MIPIVQRSPTGPILSKCSVAALGIGGCYGCYFQWLPHLLLAALLVSLYSLCIDSIFGHPTFWRKRPSTKPLKKIGGSSVLDNPNDGNLRRRPSRQRSLNEIDNLVIVQSMLFLSLKDLSSISRVSRRFNQITKEQPILWRNLSSLYFRLTPEISTTVKDMRTFIEHYLIYPEMLAQSRATGVCVVVKRIVYDLSSFVNEHPGGDAILIEWRGRDATRIFDLAHHSTFAMDLAESFLIWSPTEGPQ